MDGSSDRLGLPLLSAGQAQKELCHNEALTIIDIALQCAVESADIFSPPSVPAPGQCWIVASGATGPWAGKAGYIAGWTTGGWRFLAPREGMRGWAIDVEYGLTYRSGEWIPEGCRPDGFHVAGEKIVGARQAAIAAPTGGSTVDNEARTALIALLGAMRAHGLIAV